MSASERENEVLVGTIQRGRRGDEVLVILADFRKTTFIHLEVYEGRDDGPMFKRGLTFTPTIWKQLLGPLTTAVNLGENRVKAGRDDFAEAMLDVKGWRRSR